jgi:hypothetical protein
MGDIGDYIKISPYTTLGSKVVSHIYSIIVEQGTGALGTNKSELVNWLKVKLGLAEFDDTWISSEFLLLVGEGYSAVSFIVDYPVGSVSVKLLDKLAVDFDYSEGDMPYLDIGFSAAVRRWDRDGKE